MKKHRFILNIFCVLILSSCMATSFTESKKQIHIRVVQQSQQCVNSDDSVRILKSPNEIKNALSANRIVSRAASDRSLSEFNFDSSLYILIAAGRQATGGFSYELIKSVVDYDEKNKTLRLPLKFNRPSEGKILTQAMTSPCVIVEISKDAITSDVNSLTILLANSP